MLLKSPPPPPPPHWKNFLYEIFYIISTYAIYVYQKCYEMNGFVKFRAVSKLSTFFIHHAVTTIKLYYQMRAQLPILLLHARLKYIYLSLRDTAIGLPKLLILKGEKHISFENVLGFYSVAVLSVPTCF
jgi:hypothetical protein